MVFLVWWLVALAGGPRGFAQVQWFLSSFLGLLVLFGLTVVAWFKTLAGIRHLVWDGGYGFSLPAMMRSGQAVLVGTAVLTVLTWVRGDGGVAMSSMRTPLGRVRGLGSAKSGTHHWWTQRVTSLALLPLFLWFVFAMLSLAGAGYAESRAFLARPWNAVLMLALVGFSFHHIAAGLQVVIEDYVRAERARLLIVLAIKAACLVAALISAFAVLRVAFT